MALTIRDIARIAKVSRSTVSLALNNSPRINKETKRRVLQIVQELDYHPNAMARALVGKRTQVLSLLVPPIEQVFSDSYFSETVAGVADAAHRAGQGLALDVASDNFVETHGHERLFQERRVDGMLIVGALTTDTWLDGLRERGRPVCLIGTLWEGIASVVADNRGGTERLMDHLVNLGHREIGCIKGLDITTSGQQRDAGFRAALARHDLPHDEALIAYGNFSEESGHEAMRDLLSRARRPRAVYAMNDMMAIGAMRAVREAGLRVPDDIAIAGSDDTALARYVTPALTTVRRPTTEIGSLAVEILLECIGAGNAAPPTHRVVPTELVVRESCGAKH